MDKKTKVYCSKCNHSYINTLYKCPYCGAANDGEVRILDNIPSTISELIEWYDKQKLASYDITRFFIGIDTNEPKAFGIYYNPDSNNYVVYKNKSDGTRTIRYEGPIEAYAVNELYKKLHSDLEYLKTLFPGSNYFSDNSHMLNAYQNINDIRHITKTLTILTTQDFRTRQYLSDTITPSDIAKSNTPKPHKSHWNDNW